MKLTITHVVVITLTTTFLLLAFDRAGDFRKNQYVWVPPQPASSKGAASAVAQPDPDKGKPPPHNDKVEDLPDGKNRELVFYTCTACHGVALIKAQVLAQPVVLVHRDYHSRNLMADPADANARLGVIDFQDAVRGPVTYDLVSLLRDAYVRWVRSHNVARMSSSQAAFNAMADAYPCRSNRGDSLFDGSIFGDRSMFGDEDFSFIPRIGDR